MLVALSQVVPEGLRGLQHHCVNDSDKQLSLPGISTPGIHEISDGTNTAKFFLSRKLTVENISSDHNHHVSVHSSPNYWKNID